MVENQITHASENACIHSRQKRMVGTLGSLHAPGQGLEPWLTKGILEEGGSTHRRLGLVPASHTESGSCTLAHRSYPQADQTMKHSSVLGISVYAQEYREMLPNMQAKLVIEQRRPQNIAFSRAVSDIAIRLTLPPPPVTKISAKNA